MKKNRIFQCRVFPLLLAFSVLVFALIPIKANAAVTKSYNYEDYVSSATVSGNVKTVNVSIPVEPVRWQYFLSGAEVGVASGNVMALDVSPNRQYAIRCYVFGSSLDLNEYAIGRSYSTDALYIGNIPDGTSYDVRCDLFIDDTSATVGFANSWTDLYLDENGKCLKVVNQNSSAGCVIGQTINTYHILMSGTISKPEGAVYLVTGFQFHNIKTGSETDTLGISFYGYNLTMDIDQLSSLAEQQGKTNKLLEEIKTGSTADQEAADKFNDEVGNQTGEMDKLVGDMDKLNKPDIGSMDFSVDEFVSSDDISLLAGTITPVMQNELVIGMFMIVSICVFASFVLFGKKG